MNIFFYKLNTLVIINMNDLLHVNTTKIVVNFFIIVFIIISTMTILLLILYYLTPNNYILVPLSKFNYHKLFKEYLIELQPNSQTSIPLYESNEYYLKFQNITNINSVSNELDKKIYLESTSQTNEIKLLIKNIFKSESINYTDKYLIKTKYNSDIIILNQSMHQIKILVSLWK